jgi:hypothetical protein
LNLSEPLDFLPARLRALFACLSSIVLSERLHFAEAAIDSSAICARPKPFYPLKRPSVIYIAAEQ